MKRMILILVASLFLFGCGKNVPKDQYVRSVVVNGATLYVYNVEGHEYLGYVKPNGNLSIHPTYNSFLTHSATCPNPIHDPKKGTVMVTKDGKSFTLPDTLVEKQTFDKVGNTINIK